MKKVCIIGYPAKHSLSPAIHGYWLEKYGISGKYEIRETLPENFDDFFKNLAQEGYVGCNITVPFKERAFELSGEILHSPEGIAANISKAVNTIFIKDREYVGLNTDCIGFIKNIENNYKEFDVEKSKALVLGAGGASRAIVTAFLLGNAHEIIIINRDKKRAEKVLEDLEKFKKNSSKNNFKTQITIVDWESRSEALKDANLLVNTTSLGMVGQPPLDINLDLLPKDALVTDIVYRPLITPILQMAKDRGNPIVDGLGMLLYQAVPGFEMWFAEELAEIKSKDPSFRGVEVTEELRRKIEALL